MSVSPPSSSPCSPVWAWWDPRSALLSSHAAPGDTCVLCRDVRQKVQLAIAQAFGISASSLYLTKPTFFSRINSTEARTAHDEYWHAHVDKVRLAARHQCGGGTWHLSTAAPARPWLAGKHLHGVHISRAVGILLPDVLGAPSVWVMWSRS